MTHYAKFVMFILSYKNVLQLTVNTYDTFEYIKFNRFDFDFEFDEYCKRKVFTLRRKGFI